MPRTTFTGRFLKDDSGLAALETALVTPLFVLALLNVVEVGRYAYTVTQVAAASQAGAQAAIVHCEHDETPLTTNCAEGPGAVAAAVRGTSLGDSVSLEGALDEGWYCVNASGTLQRMAAASETKPADCTAAGVAGGAPSLYLIVQAGHDYEPTFPGLTLAESFPDRIVRTARMRLS